MLYLLIFILGLIIGSFLNVVIFRLETDKSILFGRSFCPKCRAVLKWYDLIPVLSFLIQKGKCRYCDKKISWQYPMVEIATGLLFLFVFLNQFLVIPNFSGVIPNLIGNLDYISINWIPAFAGMTFYLIIICFLIIIFVYDLRHYIIPDKIVFPAIIIGLIYRLISMVDIWNYFLSAFIPAAFFLSLIIISKGKWMGLGDVKLAFLMGLILGWPNILIALLISFFLGSIIGIFLIIFGKKGLKSQIPFGPFLVGSTILVIFFGAELFYWFKFLLYF